WITEDSMVVAGDVCADERYACFSKTLPFISVSVRYVKSHRLRYSDISHSNELTRCLRGGV
ncbi:hypothetical protein CEXT_263311, partial [Caerostris extrusa]